MKRFLLTVLLAISLPGWADAAEAELWIVAPAPHGDLSDCPERAPHEVMAESPAAHRLDAAARLRWGGGVFQLRGAADAAVGWPQLVDRCFALLVDGRVVAAGATLLPYSARRLRFPVLQVLPHPPDQALDLNLAPQFPAVDGGPIPQDWRDALTDLR